MATRVYAQQAVATASFDPARTDEDLMRDLAHGQQDALGPLYSRYASLVFQIGVQSLDRAAAEELLREGYKNVFNLEGGIEAWSASVDPSVPRY